MLGYVSVSTQQRMLPPPSMLRHDRGKDLCVNWNQRTKYEYSARTGNDWYVVLGGHPESAAPYRPDGLYGTT